MSETKIYKRVLFNDGFELHMRYSPDETFEHYLDIGINKNSERGVYFNLMIELGDDFSCRISNKKREVTGSYINPFVWLAFDGNRNRLFLLQCFAEIPKDLADFLSDNDNLDVELNDIMAWEVVTEQDMLREIMSEAKPDLNRFPRQLDRKDVRSILGDLRFDMSGYNSCVTGDCVEHNRMILGKFSKFGIFNYTHFLYLDFYKGMPTIHYRYWGEDEVHEEELDCPTTSEIIVRILELTVYSGKEQRRNWEY